MAVGQDEPLSRFLTESGHFTLPGRTKKKAFEPGFNSEQQRHETSLFRISALSDSEIWDIGVAEVATPRNKPLLARTDILAGSVRGHAPLDVIEDEPPPRHAVIVGWPGDKFERMNLQQLLAEDADLKQAPN